MVYESDLFEGPEKALDPLFGDFGALDTQKSAEVPPKVGHGSAVDLRLGRVTRRRTKVPDDAVRGTSAKAVVIAAAPREKTVEKLVQILNRGNALEGALAERRGRSRRRHAGDRCRSK